MLPKIKYIIIVAACLSYSCEPQKPNFSINETNIYGTKIDIGYLLDQPNALVYLSPYSYFGIYMATILLSLITQKMNRL